MEDIFDELAAEDVDDIRSLRSEEEDDERGGNRDDEAEEVNTEKKRIVKPKKTVAHPRFTLDTKRLLADRGIASIPSYFNSIKFKGKGHEMHDLNEILSRLEHWAHRLYPKFTFIDCINRVEELGSKKVVQVQLHRMRSGEVDENDVQRIGDSENPLTDDNSATPVDPFDALMPKAQAPTQTASTLTDEQRARMMRNRMLAEERRMERMRQRALEEQMAAQQSAEQPQSDCVDLTDSSVSVGSQPGTSGIRLSPSAEGNRAEMDYSSLDSTSAFVGRRSEGSTTRVISPVNSPASPTLSVN